jgi:hypothetical protein
MEAKLVEGLSTIHIELRGRRRHTNANIPRTINDQCRVRSQSGADIFDDDHPTISTVARRITV